MHSTHILGFPRIGSRRELKLAQEAFWRGDTSADDLITTARSLRQRHWAWQQAAGLRFVSVGDFSLYDHVLDTAVLLGALPRRFGFDAQTLGLADYFALARGNAAQPALEMTKWFDTNYHYLKPELDVDTRFDGGQRWLFDDIAEAQSLGLPVKVQLLGPLSFLRLARVQGVDALALLPRLVPAYQRLLADIKAQGVSWVQIDEPILALDLPADWLAAFTPVYRELALSAPSILLASYFGSVANHAALLAALPVAGLHIDLIRAPEQLADFLAVWPANKVLSLGVIDGRNVWKRDLDAALDLLASAQVQLGDQLWLAPSCSLLHVPVDLAQETQLDPALRGGLSFARQKLEELALLQRAASLGRAVCFNTLAQHRDARAAWQQIHGRERPEVRAALNDLPSSERALPYPQRAPLQAARLQLPLLPTTTIGSFPQTASIRQARATHRRGELSDAAYQQAMEAEITLAVRKQEEIGLDMLVHGEAERNDMVEYFSSQLAGFAATDYGWVQSYGSRCVKPPLIWGDVARPHAMTVGWTRYAQSLTTRPMKGMLTGPVTLLQWSFVRDDLPRATVALQLALALRDEVRDLEAAGIAAIQIDEPAFREGLPLKTSDWQSYLDWAVQAFRLAASVAQPATQIHTHMCYSEFEDILPAIAALDADVITIETARSDMTLLDAFAYFAYPNEIGPGVYDIHSPRVPSADAMVRLLEKALAVVPAERLWINPDCGLKTRGWVETEAALREMVGAARRVREVIGERL